MNRAERRRFERIGIHAKEIEEVVAKKTQDKFDVAFSILIDTLSVAMRNNRISAERIDKVFTEAGDMLKEQGHELAMETIKKLGGLKNG